VLGLKSFSILENGLIPSYGFASIEMITENSSFKRLQRYSKIYKNPRIYGSDAILRNYLKLPLDFPVAVSIGHGVDVGHGSVPFDSWSIEPIHWCTNRFVYEKSQLIKPSVLMPHPWSMLVCIVGSTNQSTSESNQRLVILPPPGLRNDSAVYQWWKRFGSASDVFLVKPRQGYKRSIEYFNGLGIRTACIESLNSEFYQNLLGLFNSFESVIGLTASSALYMAASIGLKVQIWPDFYYEFCDVANYRDIVSYSSDVQSLFIRFCLEEKFSEASLLAQEILGFDLLANCIEVRRCELLRAYCQLSSPVFPVPSGSSLLSFCFEKLGLIFEKPRLVSQGSKALLGWFCESNFAKNQAKSIVKMNEISCILNGVNSFNLNIRPYSGTCVPGDGF
jgi:hypothetical protein